LRFGCPPDGAEFSMTRDNDRIDGWKAIGDYFGRDRTTAIRWAKDRALPVRSMPGGKTRTVYAYRGELDAWAGMHDTQVRNDQEAVSEPPVDPIANLLPAPASSKLRRFRWLMAVMGVVTIIVIGTILVTRTSTTPARELPADAQVAALFLQARDDWAQRSAASVEKSISEFEGVTRRDPNFAPAFSGLADAYLLAREVGALPDSAAFGRAGQAAERAVRLDPDLAAAHRALGFIAYWWNHDRSGSGEAFQNALRLAPKDAQTHFWYGNILADNGEHIAAMRELDAARLLDPGSIPIRTDRAWALWMAGYDGDALAELNVIITKAPDTEEAHDCLSVVYLSRGDYPAYVREMHERARLRAAPDLNAHVRALDRALATHDRSAMQALILQRALTSQIGVPFPSHAWSAYVANLSANSNHLVSILQLADQQHEQWGAAGYTRRIAQRWRNDPRIMTLLRRRAAPLIERLGSGH